MARGAAQAQRKRRAPEEPKRKKKAAPSWEEQLFFSRLRRHAKVMYVLLAVVFAAGFVVLGVGSGSTGIGDILQGKLFGGGSSSSTSSQIKDKQQALVRNPKDVSLYLDLAGLYQADQNESQALSTLRKAEKVAPKNVDVLNRIALIYSSRAGRARSTAENAQILYLSNTTAPPGLDTNSQLGQALASDPYSDALRNKASTAYSKMVTAYTAAEGAYRRVVATTKGTSEESSAQLQLASAAQTAGDIPTAVTAYERFLKIAPDDPNAAAVRQTLTQLKASLPKGQ
jgi:cytochrome c-type biogenesis protein CcmH/NrfG